MTNVPERVKKALFEKGWTQKRLCAEIDVSENGFKNMSDKNTWKLETLEKMAEALGVPVAYFVAGSNENFDSVKKSQLPEDGFLREFSQKMEAKFDRLSLELDTKNQQIAGLQRMLESVLGKSEGAILDQLSSGDPVFDGMMREYKAGMLGNVIPSPTIKSVTLVAKFVALSSPTQGTWSV